MKAMPGKAKKPSLKETYLKELARRGKESHVYRKYQLMGLEISQTLRDERHKALYIKLAKESDGDRLRALAKDVASRDDVKNKGAYFMAILKKESSARIEATEKAEKEKKGKTAGNGQRNSK